MMMIRGERQREGRPWRTHCISSIRADHLREG
ncbi:Protein CBG26239 [Caenorhabditis briggsae]|uniref:Protein CBG26239 n=1 Tax=Caenorhabditis briggsae TaxID=6238 RepID=B6IIZ4_CAEBR|nr:Protein CBG26239 [Caenorhabditis briggsae]CAR99874.1 Protein CBG26239 [Caenorhabditis briggsae]